MRGTEDASSYAITWIRQTEADYLNRLPQLYDTWMDYYEREGIEAVTYGLITMRRSSGRANWVRFMKVAIGSGAPGGDHVLRLFQLQDFLESTSDDHLLDHRFRLAPERPAGATLCLGGRRLLRRQDAAAPGG